MVSHEDAPERLRGRPHLRRGDHLGGHPHHDHRRTFDHVRLGAAHFARVSSEQANESNDAQIIAAFFRHRDAQALGGSNPTTGTANPSLGVSITDAAGCGASIGNLVMRFEWIDQSTTPVTIHISTYSYVSADAAPYKAHELVRRRALLPPAAQPPRTRTSSRTK